MKHYDVLTLMQIGIKSIYIAYRLKRSKKVTRHRQIETELLKVIARFVFDGYTDLSTKSGVSSRC
jgi:hypothetical protein